MIVDGEAFLQFVTTPDGLRLRLLPAEMVDEKHTIDLGGGARVIGGVEFDQAGKRVAYWVSPVRPEDFTISYLPPVRVPASEILHLYRPMGAGQVRGMSWLAPVLVRLNEMDQLEDALLVGAKVAAMHAGFLVDQNGSAGDSPFDGQQVGNVMESGLEPGTLRFLPAGWDIRFSTPQQAAQSVQFAQMQLRAIASGLGVPVHLMTGDLTGANYSSLRAGTVAFQQRVEQIQFQTVIPQLVRPTFSRAVSTLVLSGSLQAPDFETRTADYLDADFYPPAQPWVDPLKDQEAEALAVQNGFKSRRQVVAAQGFSIEALDTEIAADRQREKALGLTFPAPGATPQPQPQPQPQPEESDNGQ
jgi:lambda family phage portal protein